jgi:hypothetical protein
MAVDQSILSVEKKGMYFMDQQRSSYSNALSASWPSSTSDGKLDQVLRLVSSLGREVDTLKADIVGLDKKVIFQGEAIEWLKDTNTTIQSQVHTIEVENEDLRQAVDGVGAFI